MSQGDDTPGQRPHKHLTVVQGTPGWQCEDLGHIFEFGDPYCVHCGEHFGDYLPVGSIGPWATSVWEIEQWARDGLERTRGRREEAAVRRARREGYGFALVCFLLANTLLLAR